MIATDKGKQLFSKLEEYALKQECTSKNLDKCLNEIAQTFGSPVPDEIKSELVNEFKSREQKFDNIQLANKILMNALYGYFGTKTSRFYIVAVAEAITLTGQDESRRVQELLEKEGYIILYGDTDSMFILVKGMPDEIKDDIEKAKKWIRDKFVPRINELAQQELESMAREIGIHNPILDETYHFKFKQEMIARSGIFLPAVSKKDEAKKRYDLWVIDEEGVPKDKFSSAGTPLKQSKLPNIVKEYFLKFISKLLKEMVNDENELLSIARELREKIINACENWELEHLGSQTQFNKPLDQYPESKSEVKFAIKWNNEIAPILKLPEFQLNFKYKFIEVVPKQQFTPVGKVKELPPEHQNLIRKLHQFVLKERVKMVGVVDLENQLLIDILRSIFDIDVDRILEKYVNNIFKPYFKVLNIPIEKIAFDIGDLDDLL